MPPGKEGEQSPSSRAFGLPQLAAAQPLTLSVVPCLASPSPFLLSLSLPPSHPVPLAQR